MTELTKGDVWHDPETGQDLEVLESVRTAGRSTRELDRETVKVRFEDGEGLTVPHERFRKRRYVPEAPA